MKRQDTNMQNKLFNKYYIAILQIMHCFYTHYLFIKIKRGNKDHSIGFYNSIIHKTTI